MRGSLTFSTKLLWKKPSECIFYYCQRALCCIEEKQRKEIFTGYEIYEVFLSAFLITNSFTSDIIFQLADGLGIK